MLYKYVDRTIFLEDKEILLNMYPDDEDKPYIQNKKTKEKTFITMHDISNFTWEKGKKKWHLKIHRDDPTERDIKRFNKTETVPGCTCSITSEIID